MDWSSLGGPPAAHCRTPPWVDVLSVAYALHPLSCSCAPGSLPKAKSLSPSSIFRGTWARMFSRSDVTSAPSLEEGCRDQLGGCRTTVQAVGGLGGMREAGPRCWSPHSNARRSAQVMILPATLGQTKGLGMNGKLSHGYGKLSLTSSTDPKGPPAPSWRP